MSSYEHTRIDVAEFLDGLRFDLPLAIDDMSLAHSLGIRNKTMWWLINSKRAKHEKEQPYETFKIAKRSRRGGKRSIQNPKPRLKAVQRAILGAFLQPIPLGEHVGAYVPGRSCMDTAKQHVGQGLIISLDIKDFFPSVKRSHIRNYFKWVGYNHSVAGYLAELLTYKNFVPQGSPASGLIANIIADFRFDHVIMDKLGQMPMGWTYTRYSDDIDISTPKRVRKERVSQVVDIVRTALAEAGFRLNAKKTKVEPYYRQQKVLGVVVNEKTNIPRKEYDRLRCLIHNCMIHGFHTQIDRAEKPSVDALKTHIRGKLSYLSQVAPAKAEALTEKFELAQKVHKDDLESTGITF